MVCARGAGGGAAKWGVMHSGQAVLTRYHCHRHETYMYIHALCSQPRIYVINYTCYASTIRRAPCPPHTSTASSPAYIPLCHAAGQISSDHTSRFSASWSFCPTSRRCWLTLFRRDSHVATEMVIKEKTIHAMRMPSSRPIWFFVLKMICGSAVGRQEARDNSRSGQPARRCRTAWRRRT